MLPYILAMLLFFSVVHDLFAHGPGRQLRVEMGYCVPNSSDVLPTQRMEAHALGEWLPFCFRMRNLEPFPVAVRLRFLSGSTLENGTDVCLMKMESESFIDAGFFQRQGQACQKTSLMLESQATEDIQGQWVFASNRATDSNPMPPSRTGMVSCVLGEASPLDPGRSHTRGLHVKARRSLHMVRIQASLGLESGLTRLSPTFQDHREACDPVTPFLASTALEKSLSPAKPTSDTP